MGNIFGHSLANCWKIVGTYCETIGKIIGKEFVQVFGNARKRNYRLIVHSSDINWTFIGNHLKYHMRFIGNDLETNLKLKFIGNKYTLAGIRL